MFNYSQEMKIFEDKVLHNWKLFISAERWEFWKDGDSDKTSCELPKLFPFPLLQKILLVFIFLKG